jgi:hypothetical protein
MKKILTGAVVATAVAGFFLAGNAVAAESGAKEAKTVKCWGANACKGKTGCKTSKNACAGKNGCKGQGWEKMTEKECTTKGGSTSES